MKLKLTSEQTSDLPFPLGCSVWYNFPSQQSSKVTNNASNSSNNDELPILKRGIVDSVSLDFVTRDMIYNIIYKDDNDTNITIDEVAEKELYYGSSCPVTIAAEEEDDGNSDEAEGTVLYCEQSKTDPSKIVYTIMIYNEGTSQVRYVEDIQAERVKYRNIQVVPTNKEAEEEEVKRQDVVDNQNKTVAAVPSSITCESNTSKSKKRDSIEDGEIISDDASRLNKKMKEQSPHHSVGGGSSRHSLGGSMSGSDHRINDRGMANVTFTTNHDGERETDHHGTRIDIRLPTWLQRDYGTQSDLFLHLIGRRHKKARSVFVIGKETNCNIRVNYKPPHGTEDLNKDQVSTDPMSITIHANSKQFSQRDLGDARCKIQHLLLDYVGGDGSRGRLVYEIALSCWGYHRPKNSTSNAVKVSDPFHSGTGRFMTVLPLPYQLHSRGNKVYHAANLLISEVQRRITYEANSYIKLVGDEFKVPCRLCEPYVLVMGSSLQGVDKGAEIVKEVVKKHVATCTCTFS